MCLVCRGGAPASDSACFSLHFKHPPPPPQRQEHEGRNNVVEDPRPSQRTLQIQSACVGTPRVAEEEQQEQAAERSRARGRIARKAVGAGRCAGRAGAAARHRYGEAVRLRFMGLPLRKCKCITAVTPVASLLLCGPCHACLSCQHQSSPSHGGNTRAMRCHAAPSVHLPGLALPR